MSSYFTDLNGLVATGLESAVSVAKHSTSKKAGQDLQMEDFLQLMVATFQNQTIDNQADISDMMNQMVQMSVVQAITNISTLITESTNLSYAASLVGKEVIIAQQEGRTTKQITGTVTGTGTLNGEPVLFMGDKSYWLSDVLAVGQLPSEEAQAENAQAVKDAEKWENERKNAVDAELAARNALNLIQNDDKKSADAVSELIDAVGDTQETSGEIPVEVLEDAAQQIGTE